VKIGGGNAGPDGDKTVTLGGRFRNTGNKNVVEIGLLDLEDIYLQEL
jgi:hypothetical protein